jgi:DNA repair exonuclease SbcCD ATPase subunit
MANSITKEKLFYEDELNRIKQDIINIKTEIENDNNFINKKRKRYDKLVLSKNLGEEINDINKEIKEVNKELKIFIKIEKEYLANYEFNKTINEKIEGNRKGFNLLENHKNEEYEEYLELKDKFNELNNEYLELKDKLNTIINKNDKLLIRKKELDEINKNKNIYNEIDELKYSLNQYKEKEVKLDKECKEIVSKINSLVKEINKNDLNFQIINKNKEQISKNNLRKETLGIIKNATDSGGILDEIMRITILPTIENIINEILNDVDTYKIKITYDSAIRITKIENNTEQESSGLMASGHEKSVLNIIFRLALSKLNSMISTNFFIIDEAFKNSDANKKQKLKTLFEYLRNNYDWVLIVTHDDYIKDNFDKEINIEHSKGTSYIKF